MKYQELIDACIDIRKSWNPVTMTVDAHAEEYLKKVSDPNEKVFIKQVFYGSYRYEDFINAFNQSMFKVHTAQTNRNDGQLFGVFLYLTIFRFDELPFSEYKKMVLSQNPVKMNVFFQFLFDENMVRSHVKDEWCKIYDEDFIENNVIGFLQGNLTKMADLLAVVSKKATGKVSELVTSIGTNVTEKEKKEKTFKPTEPKPFKITQAKIKALPPPIMIPKIVKSNPVPETTYGAGLKKVLEGHEERKKKVTEDTKAKYTGIEKLKQYEKNEKELQELQIKKEMELQEQITMKTHYNPAPIFENQYEDVPLTTAAILKDDAIIKQQKKAEEDYLKQVEANMRDSTEFKKWQKENLMKDEIKRLEEQEKKRVEMQLAREAAMKAVEEKNQKNKKNVGEMKKISEKNQTIIEKKKLKEVERKKKLKDAVIETEGNGILEREKIAKTNKIIHDNVKKEKKKMVDLKKQELEIEMEKKKELIAKIRELEKIPIPRTRAYDPTETAGHGLLEEMTIIELRERLEEQKRLIAEHREKKRVEILGSIDKKKTDLQEKVVAIKELRQEQALLAAQKRKERKEQIEREKQLKKEIHEKHVLEVSDKIQVKKENKQQELERIAKDLREIKLKRQFLNANAAMVEEHAWKSLQDGSEREIRDRQNVKLLEQEQVETTKFKERKIIAKRAVETVEAKLNDVREYDERVDKAKEENEVLYREEREAKKKRNEEIRLYEQAHLQNMQSRDPFKTKIASMSLTSAKQSKISRDSKGRPGSKEQNVKDFVLPPSKYDENRGSPLSNIREEESI